MMEVIWSSETLVLTRSTWGNIQEDSILHRINSSKVNYKAEDSTEISKKIVS
jgi:hypothetical protein